MSDHSPQFDAEIERRYEAALLRWRGDRTVVGVDVGFVYDGRGRMTGAIDVRVHRRASAVVGPMGVTAAPAEASPSHAMGGSAGDTLRPGVRIANPRCTVGTLGPVVFDAKTNRPLLMSSSHVLGAPGTSQSESINLVPSGTAKPRVIATFARAVNDSTGDAAVAIPVADLQVDVALRTDAPIARAALPQLGDTVEKIGAATGRTCGVVDGLGRYFLSGSAHGMLGFRIVRAIPGCARALAEPGDSGAAWYRRTDHVGVGLHVGSDQSITDEGSQPAIACHLPLVLETLGVRLMRVD